MISLHGHPVPAVSAFDGELVVLSERDGRPTQGFAAVTRGVLTGSQAPVARLTFFGFDMLRLAGEDQCARPCERDAALRDALPYRSRPPDHDPASVPGGARGEGALSL